MSYGAFETLVAPARASAALWRTALVVVLTGAGFIALNLAYFGTLRQVMGPEGWGVLATELAQGSTPRAVLVMLFNFVALALALAVAVLVLHGRFLWSLIGPAGSALRDFTRVLLALALLNLVLWILPWPGKVQPEPHAAFDGWLSLLPLALLAIAVQTATEELGFRGYLQTQLAAWSPSPLIWMGLPSLVFALLHLDFATFGDNAWVVAVWAFLFGLTAADLTARAGNLGPALALHLMNNVSAILIYALAGHWDGLALHVLPVNPADTQSLRPVLLVEGGVLLVGWLAARVAIRR